jgi:hypothetical protein
MYIFERSDSEAQAWRKLLKTSLLSCLLVLQTAPPALSQMVAPAVTPAIGVRSSSTVVNGTNSPTANLNIPGDNTGGTTAGIQATGTTAGNIDPGQSNLPVRIPIDPDPSASSAGSSASSQSLAQVQPAEPSQGTPQASPTGTANQPPPRNKNVFKGLINLLERDFGMPEYNPPSSPPLPRRAPPAPLDPVFPSSEFLGTNAQAPMGVNDNNYAQYPLEQWLWNNVPILRKERIRIYGWLNPGYNYGTSPNSNFPMSYIVASRKLHWDQVVLRFERVPDTVQREHMDWGFRATSLYGEDYRFTTSKGWLSNQLLLHNYLTGWDPCELFGVLYVPQVAGKKLFDGVEFRVGRYISCPDIEAQLAPDNYLFTHSLMFTVDTYTQTGIQSWLQLNKFWNVMFGFHSGADTAPWTNSTVPTGQCLIRWTSRGNKDALYFGVNDINGLPFQNGTNYTPPGSQGKDNLQQVNVNWTHVFNRRFHTVTEWYYLWTRDALTGGTVSNGPVHTYGGGGGPGTYLPGYSTALGIVNYTLFRMTAKDYLTLRPIDFLVDPRGWRTGYPTTYYSGTIGWCHRFSDTLCIRPELRAEQSLRPGVTPYNNGTRRGQFTFACDIIQRF